MDLEYLDKAIFIFVLIVVLCGGYFAKNQLQSIEDYCLGGRKINTFYLGLSVFATYVSGLAFLGAPAWSFKDGLQTLILQINFPFVVMLVAYFLVPKIYELKLISIYDFHKKRFGSFTQKFTAITFLVTQVLGTAGILYATSLIFSYIFGIHIVYAILFTALFTAFYSTSGGLRAVVFTDIIQVMVMFAGLGFVSYAVISEFLSLESNSDSSIMAGGRILNFNMDLSDKYTVYSGLIGMTLYRIKAYGASQLVLQRVIAANSVKNARRTLIFTGVLTTPILCLLLVLGYMLRSLYQVDTAIPNTNLIILDYISKLAVPGLLGLMISTVFAASTSSLDSALNSMATVFYQTFDIKGYFGLLSEINILRLITIIFVVLIIVPAYLFSINNDSILERVVSVGSYFAGIELFLFISGFYLKTTTELDVMISSGCSLLIVIYTAIYTEITWTWYCVIGFLASVLFLAIIKISRKIYLRIDGTFSGV